MTTALAATHRRDTAAVHRSGGPRAPVTRARSLITSVTSDRHDRLVQALGGRGGTEGSGSFRIYSVQEREAVRAAYRGGEGDRSGGGADGEFAHTRQRSESSPRRCVCTRLSCKAACTPFVGSVTARRCGHTCSQPPTVKRFPVIPPAGSA